MLQIDQLANINSYRNIHPVEKGLFALLFLLFCLLTKNVVVAFYTFFVMSSTIVLGAKIPLAYYLKMLLLPIFFLVTSVLTILISIAPANMELIDSLLSTKIGSWQLYISQTNYKMVIQLIFTVIASVSCMYFFILTTPIHQIAWLLQRLWLPPLFIELFLFTYRFIFVLLEKFVEIRLAHSSRLGYQTYRNAILSSGQLVVSLLIKSMRSARELQIAIETRGGGEEVFDRECTQSYRLLHWLMLVCSFLLLSFLTAFI
ncbi:cobalt ECF transporter T component CbiQ [Halalkalibacterium ligniniphilum]|uniref:cobalt ECF transporter T component CbiQ n=1 Tax=Halalkalibacterium ligniniphilum TaxID=1134413 RepID=UPI0003463D6D|nr:cobalt ECF transporter T component CbiQ [Halalkalibacterium ligniniphilum]